MIPSNFPFTNNQTEAQSENLKEFLRKQLLLKQDTCTAIWRFSMIIQENQFLISNENSLITLVKLEGKQSSEISHSHPDSK